LARRGNPLDQAQCNFVLLCLAQQRIPFVAGGKPFGLLAKSFDLIAQAINVRGFVQDRILRFSCYPYGYGQLAGRFRTVERLSAHPPDFQPGGAQAASASVCPHTPRNRPCGACFTEACAIDQLSSNMALPNRSGIVQSPEISCIWHSPGNAPFNRASLSPSMAASSLPSADAATTQLKMR